MLVYVGPCVQGRGPELTCEVAPRPEIFLHPIPSLPFPGKRKTWRGNYDRHHILQSELITGQSHREMRLAEGYLIKGSPVCTWVVGKGQDHPEEIVGPGASAWAMGSGGSCLPHSGHSHKAGVSLLSTDEAQVGPFPLFKCSLLICWAWGQGLPNPPT